MNGHTEVSVRKLLVSGSVLLGAAFLVASSSPTRFEALRSSTSPAALVSPMRIAEGPPGQVVVSDSRENRVVGLDEDTRAPLWSFNIQGTPMAVGYVSRLLLIGNASTHHVEVYRMKRSLSSTTLEFQFNLDSTPGGIRVPSDLAIDKDARLVFVLDSGERSVKVFDLSGDTVSSFPPLDALPPLLSPTAIAVDPIRQEVLVSDYGDPNGYFRASVAPRVMVYTYAGEFVTMFDGGVANKEFQFARPQGLATDSLGHVFMADSLLGQVFVFDRETGSVMRKLGAFGNGPGELTLPMDVAIGPKTGDLLVTNNMLGRIEVFPHAGESR